MSQHHRTLRVNAFAIGPAISLKRRHAGYKAAIFRRRVAVIPNCSGYSAHEIELKGIAPAVRKPSTRDSAWKHAPPCDNRPPATATAFQAGVATNPATSRARVEAGPRTRHR